MRSCSVCGRDKADGCEVNFCVKCKTSLCDHCACQDKYGQPVCSDCHAALPFWMKEWGERKPKQEEPSHVKIREPKKKVG